jgi:peptide/nickel transport system permease protein
VLTLILSRALQGIIVLLVVSALTFALLGAAGGDALSELGTDKATSEATIREMRRVYGLDEPLVVRYARWLGGLVRGRMGESFYYHTPVATIIWPRLLRTLALAAVALALALAVALALAALAATHRTGGWWDRASELVILLTSSTPRSCLRSWRSPSSRAAHGLRSAALPPKHWRTFIPYACCRPRLS